MHHNPTLYLKCNCHSEMLVVEVDNDPKWVADPSNPDFNFAFFREGHGYPLTWLERIRLCWHILIRGQMFYDEIILNRDRAMELVEFLLKSLK